MNGDVGRGKIYVHRFKAQGQRGVTVFVFAKRCASGVWEKKKAMVEKGGRKGIHIH